MLFFSMPMTDFFATFILRAVSTEVIETTIIEEGPTTASIEANLDVAGVVETDALVKLRPSDYDNRDSGDGRREGWRVWNSVVSL